MKLAYHTWFDTEQEAREEATQLSLQENDTYFLFANDDNECIELMNDKAVDRSMPNIDFCIAHYTNGEED